MHRRPPSTNTAHLGPAVVSCLVLLTTSVSAVVTTYTNETDYLNALLRHGLTPLTEGFEDESVWDLTRSPLSASSITNQGVTWTSNYPSNQITTGPGPARTGAYGFWSSPHGNYTSGDPCTIPGDCGDGFKGSAPVSAPLFAVGGWITGSHGSKIDVFLNGSTTAVAFKDSTAIGSAFQFIGVIDTAGITQFEFREMEGTKEDAKYIWADDFTLAVAEDCGSNSPPTSAFTVNQTDADVIFTDTSSDSDGSIVQWFWDFGDGTSSNLQNPNHQYAKNGTFTVILYVRDNEKCTDASPSQEITIDTYPPPTLSISQPQHGYSVSGTITLSVTASNLANMDEIKYYIDDLQIGKSQADPFSIDWNSSSVSDGEHTIQARSTDLDEIETWSAAITVTVTNLPAPTQLEIWRMRYFPTIDLTDPGKESTVWGNDADPDHDGNNNGKEYAFGGIPTDPSDYHLHTQLWTSSEAGGQTRLHFSYRQRTNDPTLNYSNQVSTSLQTWLTATPSEVIVTNTVFIDGEIQQITFKSGDDVTGDRIFARVLVTTP